MQETNTCVRHRKSSVISLPIFSVFKIVGNEFAVISQRSDYENIDELVNSVYESNKAAASSNVIIIACGMEKFSNEECVAVVFEKADKRMMENKIALKQKKI